MLGKIVVETCEKCGTEQKSEYCITDIFEDKDSEFYYDGQHFCCECEHKLNSIRVKTAKNVGSACF